MSYANYQHWKTTPISGKPYLSVIIPAYNESERIIPTIGAIASHISGLGFEWELIVADDGSKDDTVTVLESLNFANMRVLKTPQNGGKGSAVRRGILSARGDYVLFTDADNSTPIEEVDTLLEKLITGGYDLAVGSRAAEGATTSNKSLLRKTLSNGLRWIVRGTLGVRVRDTQCGFKLFTRDAARRLFSTQTIDGFSFDLEILYLAKKFGLKTAEVPVQWMDAPGSKVDTRKEVKRFVTDISRIRLNGARGVYEGEATTLFTENIKRIAIVTTYPPGKGSLNEYAYHFIEALRHKPEIEQVTILADELPNDEQYPTIPHEDGTAQVSIIPSWRFGAWDNARRIQSAVEVLQPDAVLFNIQFASFAGARIPGALGLTAPALVKATTGIPTVVLLHNIMETVDLKNAGFGGNPLLTHLTRLAGQAFTRALLQADLIALTIPKYVDILREKYNAKNVFLAPHGAFHDLPLPDFKPTQANKPIKIMTFGKFGTYKRVERLIEAFDLLRQSHDSLELVIAGTDNPNCAGYLDGVRQQYSQIDGVTYTGYVEEADVPRIFTESDVVVFPYTSTTGSSGVLHQAGSYGRAVVLPQIGDFAELITEEGYTGEFFAPDDTHSLAQAIETLLCDPVKRREQGEQNYLAAKGIPISDVVDWYLIHMERLAK